MQVEVDTQKAVGVLILQAMPEKAKHELIEKAVQAFLYEKDRYSGETLFHRVVRDAVQEAVKEMVREKLGGYRLDLERLIDTSLKDAISKLKAEYRDKWVSAFVERFVKLWVPG